MRKINFNCATVYLDFHSARVEYADGQVTKFDTDDYKSALAARLTGANAVDRWLREAAIAAAFIEDLTGDVDDDLTTAVMRKANLGDDYKDLMRRTFREHAADVATLFRLIAERPNSSDERETMNEMRGLINGKGNSDK